MTQRCPPNAHPYGLAEKTGKTFRHLFSTYEAEHKDPYLGNLEYLIQN